MIVTRVRDEDGKPLGWRVTKGENPHQQIMPKWINQMRAEDRHFIDMSADAITLNTVDGPMVFKILEIPGKYCCFDGKRIEGPRSDGSLSRAYVKENFKGKKSPDPEHPAGYRTRTSYYTILEA